MPTSSWPWMTRQKCTKSCRHWGTSVFTTPKMSPSTDPHRRTWGKSTSFTRSARLRSDGGASLVAGGLGILSLSQTRQHPRCTPPSVGRVRNILPPGYRSSPYERIAAIRKMQASPARSRPASFMGFSRQVINLLLNMPLFPNRLLFICISSLCWDKARTRHFITILPVLLHALVCNMILLAKETRSAQAFPQQRVYRRGDGDESLPSYRECGAGFSDD